MKSTGLFLLTLLAFFVALPQAAKAGSKQDIGVGHPVAARWSDGKYYTGSVLATNGANFKVLFDDGDKLTVDAAHVFALRENGNFEVGDHVLAGWKGARMFPGTVTAVTAAACRIKWDDGDAPMVVKKSRIVHLKR